MSTGYRTQFRGKFTFNRDVPEDLQRTLTKLNQDRHCSSPDLLQHPPPSEHCGWILDRLYNGQWILMWDGKDFAGWLPWLLDVMELVIESSLSAQERDESPIILSGVVRYRGEAFDDLGYITVADNVVYVNRGSWPIEEGQDIAEVHDPLMR